MSRIAVDMDDVLVDTLQKELAWLSSERGVNIAATSIDGRHLRDVVGDAHCNALVHAMHEPAFFADLAVMPGAQEVMTALCRRHEVYVATAAMEFPKSFTAKFQWLKRHFPYVSPSNIVFCGDKSILQTDYLLDDNPRFLSTFCGQGLLFRSPHNLYEARFPVMQDWGDVARYFELNDIA